MTLVHPLELISRICLAFVGILCSELGLDILPQHIWTILVTRLPSVELPLISSHFFSLYIMNSLGAGAMFFNIVYLRLNTELAHRLMKSKNGKKMSIKTIICASLFRTEFQCT